MGRARRYALLAAIPFFAPVAYFYFNVVRYSVNLPIRDDYGTILAFMVKYLSAEGASEKAGLLLAQYNEHRLLFNRLVTLLDYRLLGEVDFRVLVFAGNLSLAAVTALFFHAFRRSFGARERFLFLMPAAFVIFQPQYHENITWAMASLSNFYVYLFAFLGLYFACRGAGRYTAAAFAFSAAAALTQGNGLFALFTAVPVLAYQRRFKTTAVWSIGAIGAAALYFYGYAQPGEHSSAMFMLEEPVLTARYLLSFLGSPFYLAEPAGAASIAAFAYLTWRRYYERNPEVYSFLLFLFATAAATAALRAGFGLENSLTPRYRIVPVLIAALLYMGLVENASARARRIVLWAGVAAGVAFNVLSNAFFTDELERRRNELRFELMQWSEGRLFSERTGKAEAIIRAAMDSGVYRPSFDASLLDSRPSEAAPAPEGPVTFYINYMEDRGNHHYVYGWAFLENPATEAGAVSIVLRSDGAGRVFDTVALPRHDVSKYYGTGQELLYSGFFARIPKAAMAPGEYGLGVSVRAAGAARTAFTGELLGF